MSRRLVGLAVLVAVAASCDAFAPPHAASAKFLVQPSWLSTSSSVRPSSLLPRGLPGAYPRQRGVAVASGAGDSSSPKSAAAAKETEGDVPDSATLEFADTLAERFESMWGPGAQMPPDMFTKDVTFQDPLTSLSGFDSFQKAHNFINSSPLFACDNVKITDVSAAGKRRVRARFVMKLNVKPLPWQPKVTFTGVSTLWINDDGKVTRQVDEWDSIQDQNPLSFEALADAVSSASGLWRPGAQDDMEGPEIELLRRDKDFSLKKIGPYRAIEAGFDKFTRKKAFESVRNYMKGGNAFSLTMNMSTPVMIVYEDDMAKLGKYISCFLPPKYWSGKIEAPMPWEASVLGISKRQGGTFACAEVSTEIGGRLDVLGGNEDWVSVENVFEVKAQLRGAMLREGLKAGDTWRLMRFQDIYGKGGTAYEVWIPVESFELRAAPLISASEAGVRLPGIKLDFTSLEEEEDEGEDGGVGGGGGMPGSG